LRFVLGNSAAIGDAKKILALAAVVALIVCLPLAARMSSAAGGATISLKYAQRHQDNAVLVTLTARDPQFPSDLSLTLQSYYNGAASPFDAQEIAVSSNGGGYVSYVFAVPFQGGGSYLFVGGVYDTHGNLLAESSIDPLLEPSWRTAK
jgi:hypothetical protein